MASSPRVGASGADRVLPSSEGVARRVTRRSGTHFGLSFLVLPPAQRQAIEAVYAWSRHTDDLADEPSPGVDPRTSLEEWRKELHATFDHRPGHPVTRELAPAIERFSLPRELFEEILDGCLMDTERCCYATWKELEEYCSRVAVAVGRLCVRIFDRASERAESYARNLGLALQVTNILRDLGEDARRGRVYLPLEDLQRFGVRKEDLLRLEPGPGLPDLGAFETERALQYHAAAARDLAELDASRYVAAEIMAGIYRELLRKLGRLRYQVLHRRVRVSKVRCLAIAASVWLSRRGRA